MPVRSLIARANQLGRRPATSLPGTFARGTRLPTAERLGRGQLTALIRPDAPAPLPVFVFSIIVWAVIAAITPVRFELPSAPAPYAFLALNIIALIAGLVLFGGSGGGYGTGHGRPSPRLAGSVRTLILITAALGSIGLALRGVDWFVLRGVSLEGDMYDARARLSEGAPGPVAVAAAVLVPFSFVPVILVLAARRQRMPAPWLLPCAFLAFSWPAIGLLAGSRSNLILGTLMLFFAYCCLVSGMTRRTVYSAVLTIVAIVVTSSIVFEVRANVFGMDLEHIIYESGYTHFVPVDTPIIQAIFSLPGFAFSVLFGMLSTAQHILHGVPEFLFMLENFDTSFHAFGVHQFDVLFKIGAVLLGLPYDPAAATRGVPREGIFTTFFGPAFTDFGVLAPLYVFVFGAAVSWTYSRVRRGDVAALPMYLLLLTQTAFALMVNGIIMAAAIYMNIAFGLFWLLASGLLHHRLPQPRDGLTGVRLPPASGPGPASMVAGARWQRSGR